MLRDVPHVTPHTSLRKAAAKMARTRHGLLVVVDDAGVHGVLTLRRLVLGAEAAAQGVPIRGAGDLASTRFLLGWEEEPVSELAQRMGRAEVRRAVIIGAGCEATGVVTPEELALGVRQHWRHLHAVRSARGGPPSRADAAPTRPTLTFAKDEP